MINWIKHPNPSFRSSNILKQLLIPNPMPQDKRSGKVYSLPCKDCNYIHFYDWVPFIHHTQAAQCEKGDIDKSAVVVVYNISWDDISITDQDPSILSGKIIETLHIRRRGDVRYLQTESGSGSATCMGCCILYLVYSVLFIDSLFVHCATQVCK